jgi:hypothetical protein
MRSQHSRIEFETPPPPPTSQGWYGLSASSAKIHAKGSEPGSVLPANPDSREPNQGGSGFRNM